MLTNLYRDRALVEAADVHMRRTDEYVEQAARTLVAPSRRRVLNAAARHAVDFQTWRSLVRDGGVSRAQAVKLASAVVLAAQGPLR